MKNNRLRQLLNEGKPTLGTHVLSPWPGTVEVIGQTGSDEVQKAHRQVIETALKKGVAPPGRGGQLRAGRAVYQDGRPPFLHRLGHRGARPVVPGAG